MRDRIARIFGLRMRRPVPETEARLPAAASPGGVTARCTGERPPRGEDSPLVRPYYVAHEREREARRLAEPRRRRVVVAVPHGRGTAA
ncbi:hypothetical protein [Streptomyces sp. NPDC056796]|uniref:hypothetical protein n=1 Tax=Streptomyces sp. NPDC056796 TaxID=3345947 RepID=UPI0036B6CF11